MRIAILWSELSGYLNACLKELDRTGSVELFVAHRPASEEAPFNEAAFDWIGTRYRWHDEAALCGLLPSLERFAPDVILCVNWHNKTYRKAMKRFRGQAVRIFASDRPWSGTFRQWLGATAARVYLHPLCEAMFVPGERQVEFARRMGFRPENILRGELSCDHEAFARARDIRSARSGDLRSFVYVGRFCDEKGIDVLVRAYQRYRQSSSDPWPLRCFGAGPLASLLEGVDGIELMGFCQPEDLPAVLAGFGCLVLPSIREAWGLVVHEAGAAGMPVIVSDVAGASVHLVQDGYNGYVFESENADVLARAMRRYADLTPVERSEMGEAGYRLSLQFTPRLWTRTLLQRSGEMLARLKGCA